MSWKNVENYLLGFLVIITSELQRGEAKDKRTDAFSRPLCTYCGIISLEKKRLKHEKKNPKKSFKNFTLLYPTFQCWRYNLKKEKIANEKLKKPPKKVAHNWPNPFYSTVQPRPQPTTQNWFSISWDQTSVLLSVRKLFKGGNYMRKYGICS